MMKIVVTSDWQLSQNPRDAYRLEFLYWLRNDIIRERNIKLLLFCGDLTEEKEGFGAEFVNHIARWFNKLPCPAVFIVGNHDYVDQDLPFFRFLRYVSKAELSFIEKPTFSDHISNLLTSALYLPYTRDYKRDWQRVLPDELARTKLIFTHNTFSGAISESGIALDGIPISAMPKTVRIFAGDVHVPQTLGNIVYVGAPYTVDFGDKFAGRVLVLDYRDADHFVSESVLYPGPQKRLVEIASLTDLNKIRRPTDDIYKVRFQQADRAKVASTWRAIKEWAEKNSVNVQSIEAAGFERRVPASARTDLRSPQSDEQTMRDFGQRYSVEQKTLDVGLGIVRGDKT
jgi:DNA repair exonuclease SbcCD nuclease subunit